ncbi:MAG TPA: ThuA domain-containing protein [Tepidisphaeraceae bacterium]|jgi:type 1 glutamine amidotransferase/nicotinamidase-related amidase|nr:ThuA domain-containing protein [Tepidisphaeraceae bacterium]
MKSDVQNTARLNQVFAGAFAIVSILTMAGAFADAPGDSLHLLARTRVEIAPKSGKFEVVEKGVDIDPKRTALIICDLWDKHWCDGATARVGVMAPRIDATAKALRARGSLIVHAPSDTMAFYQDTPQRRRAQEAPPAQTPIAFHWNACDPSVEPPLPIDDTDGGCDTTNKMYIAWKREHPAVEVAPQDAVSDQGREIYNLFVQHGIRNVLFCGVHANMCVLGRSFGIRAMHMLGLNPILLRDLTDAMYDPHSFPYVPHERGADLVVEHIEKFWCPSVLSGDILGDPKKLNIAVAIAEDEYHANETLPAFIKDEFERDSRFNFVILQSDSKTDFPGLETLKTADLLVMFMRRRSLPEDQLKAFRFYFDTGKPLIGIRTACHAFQNWPDFDGAVFGGHYNMHYPARGTMTVRALHSAAGNPLLRGVAPSWTTSSSLYKMLPLNEGCAPVLDGTWEDKPAEPVAWTTKQHGGRVFFTSLGSPDDFRNADFRRLLKNAVLWASDHAIEK